MTRYVNLRKYAERDPTVSFVWAPVSHYLPNVDRGLLSFLPRGIRLRAFVLGQTAPVFKQLNQLDAVMVHLFEADILLPLRRCVKKWPLLFSSTDEAPMVNRSTYPLYPNDLTKPVWRQQLRLAIDMWRVRHTDYFVPFSAWAANILKDSCRAPRDRVYPIHVGLDLELWPPVARDTSHRLDKTTKLLFVGGDFIRKGGQLLLEVFMQRFGDDAELHLVSAQAPNDLPPRVYAYRDFRPNDPRLRNLYAACDLLVVPTSADTGPLWVFIEAMASGMPIIGTDTGSNCELVRHGETGYIVPIGDETALGDAIADLIDDPPERERMGQKGRALVESHYDAAINVPRILRVMKRAVDSRRQT
ncbi:MAG: glycosyltransferase family 4 protein [Kineosporiaceae bacterium]|nr:glycosyltransferase family 4 protein [Aeromicrobium sp.]